MPLSQCDKLYFSINDYAQALDDIDPSYCLGLFSVQALRLWELVFVPTNLCVVGLWKVLGECRWSNWRRHCHPYIHLRLWRMCRLQIKKEQPMFKTPFQGVSLDAKIWVQQIRWPQRRGCIPFCKCLKLYWIYSRRHCPYNKNWSLNPSKPGMPP